MKAVLAGLTMALVMVSSACADIEWRNLGPSGGGWIQALTCDPRNPDTIYLGCDVGGFYRSDDAGKTWTIHNEGLTDYFIQSIAVHPRDSQILVLGAEGGIFRSIDGGRTWEPKRGGFANLSSSSFSAPIGALCFDPTEPEVLYAGIGRPRWGKDGRGEIYKSDDCGESWRLVTPPGTLDPRALVCDLKMAADGSYILAATDKGLYRSGDGGATWQQSNQGLPHTQTRRVAISASNPQRVYCTLATTARDGQPFDGGVYRSDNGGMTWTSRRNGLPKQVGKSGESARMTSNLMQIVLDPRDDQTAYVGDFAWVTAGIYKTTDGGLSWRRATDHFSAAKNMDFGWIKQWGPSAECLTIAPAKPERLVFGTSGHVFLSDDAGATWQQRYSRQLPDGRFASNGVAVTCSLQATPDVGVSGRWYFGSMDVGLLISEDDGQTFRTSYQGLKDAGNCFSLLQDPAQPEKLWIGTGQWGANQGYVSRSVDSGKSWKLVGEVKTGLPCGQVCSLVLDRSSPIDRRVVYATCNGFGVYKSSDDGDSWQRICAGLPEAAVKQPCRLLMNPANSSHLRLALAGNSESGSGIYETLDAGVTWVRVSANAPFADLKDFVAAPSDFNTLYICQRQKLDRSLTPEKLFPGGLFKSTDGGRTWARAFDFHFTNCVAINPTNPQIVYVGTTDHPFHDDNRASGVWKSVDGGKTWKQEVAGLSNWHISSLTIDPRNPGRLIAGTGGNGFFVGKDDAVGR
jgi:photosystem II stability/assembly factor-like uncharacterized protein